MRMIGVAILALIGTAGVAQAQCPCPTASGVVLASHTTYAPAHAPATGPTYAPGPVVTVAPAPVQVQPAPHYAWQPVVPLVSMPQTYYVGRGIVGQPTVYVPNQPIRNFVRFLSP